MKPVLDAAVEIVLDGWPEESELDGQRVAELYAMAHLAAQGQWAVLATALGDAEREFYLTPFLTEGKYDWIAKRLLGVRAFFRAVSGNESLPEQPIDYERRFDAAVAPRVAPRSEALCAHTFDSTVCVAPAGHEGPHITSNVSFPHGLIIGAVAPRRELNRIEVKLENALTARHWAETLAQVHAALEILRGAPRAPEPGPEGLAIYVASKTRHAPMWRKLRQEGEPIISTWIDEAGPSESKSRADLWRRCVAEAARCTGLIFYAEEGETLCGAFVEIGAALANGRSVQIVGTGPRWTFEVHPLVKRTPTVSAALQALRGSRPSEEG